MGKKTRQMSESSNDVFHQMNEAFEIDNGKNRKKQEKENRIEEIK